MPGEQRDGVRGGTHLSLCSKQPLWGFSGLRCALTALPCGHRPGYGSILQGLPVCSRAKAVPQSCLPPQHPGMSPLILFLVLAQRFLAFTGGQEILSPSYMNSFESPLLELDMLVLRQ